MAARGLITLFRSINPKLLSRKDRGRPNEENETAPLEFGANKAVGFITCADVLPMEADSDEEAEGDEIDSDESDDWVDVSGL